MPRRLLALLAIAMGMIVTVVVASTTTVGAATFAYDIQAIARVGQHGTGPAEIGPVQLKGSQEGFGLPPVSARGVSTTSSRSRLATNSVDEVAGLAEEAAAAARPASTAWGRTVQDFRANGDSWSRVSAHAEAASGKIYRGGTRIEEVFTRGDQ